MKRVKVWDLAVRLAHVLFGVLVVGSILTSEREASRWLHERLGLGLLGVVTFRVVWGVVGSRYARFSQFVRSPRTTLAALRAMLRGAPQRFVGHNPVGAVMVVVLLVAMLGAAVTGVLLPPQPASGGPGLVRKVHAASALVLPLLIIVHVAGVVFSSLEERQNLVLGMVTGWKRVPGDAAVESEPSSTVRVLGLLVAFVAGAAAVALCWKALRLGLP